MISLEVMDICGECPHFAPEANRTLDYGDHILLYVKTKVTCKHKEICQRTAREMLRKVESK